MSVHALVLAGGSGTRFWPLSRRYRPKQVLSLLPGGETSLLAATLRRVEPVIDDRFVVVAPAHLRRVLAEAAGIEESRVVVEPRPANTSPAVLLGTLALAATDPDAVVAVLPSDHAIDPAEALCRVLEEAAGLAQRRGVIITFGIRPTGPNTGYGYVERGEALEGDAFEVASFREKPDRETARQYVDSGRFYWNSGMFVFTASRLIQAFTRLYPDLSPLIDDVRRDPADATALECLYDALEPTSIDYAVMEKEEGLVVIEAPFAWSDVGSPSALSDLWPQDEQGNCGLADTLFFDAAGNIVVAEDRAKTVALLGVENLVVIDTPDGLLICPRDRDQDIRRVVETLKKTRRDDRV